MRLSNNQETQLKTGKKNGSHIQVILNSGEIKEMGPWIKYKFAKMST